MSSTVGTNAVMPRLHEGDNAFGCLNALDAQVGVGPGEFDEEGPAAGEDRGDAGAAGAGGRVDDEVAAGDPLDAGGRRLDDLGEHWPRLLVRVPYRGSGVGPPVAQNGSVPEAGGESAVTTGASGAVFDVDAECDGFVLGSPWFGEVASTHADLVPDEFGVAAKAERSFEVFGPVPEHVQVAFVLEAAGSSAFRADPFCEHARPIDRPVVAGDLGERG